MSGLDEFVRDLRRRGVQLWLEGGCIHYRAPRGSLQEKEKTILRARRDEVEAVLVARQSRVEHLRASPVTTSIRHLAAAGFWLEVIGAESHLRAHAGANLAAVDDVVIEALAGREAEIVAFLQKPWQELSPSERTALDYAATGPLVVGASQEFLQPSPIPNPPSRRAAKESS